MIRIRRGPRQHAGETKNTLQNLVIAKYNKQEFTNTVGWISKVHNQLDLVVTQTAMTMAGSCFCLSFWLLVVVLTLPTVSGRTQHYLYQLSATELNRSTHWCVAYVLRGNRSEVDPHMCRNLSLSFCMKKKKRFLAMIREMINLLEKSLSNYSSKKLWPKYLKQYVLRT